MNKKIKEKIVFLFELKELKKILQFNFREIIAKAKKVKALDFSCPACGKKDPHYKTNISNPKNNKLFQIKVCSLNCLKEYLNQNIKNNSFLRDTIPAQKGLEREIIWQLAKFLNFQELEQIRPADLKVLIKEQMRSFKKKRPCSYCQQEEKGWDLSVTKINSHDYKDILNGEFCSKKCLKKFYDEKI